MIGSVIFILFALPCFFLSLRRGLHLYQLESYFTKGYTRALGAHARRLFCAKTIFPLILFTLSGIFFPYISPLFAGLYVLLNLPQKMKKPLVYTARIKRLIFTSALLSLCLCATAFKLGAPVFCTVVSLVVLFTPYLLIMWGSINAPLERALSNRYIKEARDMLRSHKNLKIIGITGSYGKTSTKYFLSRLMGIKYRVFPTPGNFNTTLGVTRAVREGLKPYHEVFICEMGARHIGDVREICELVCPETGIITSVGPQHLETFGSLDGVLRGKLELFEAVKAEGLAILNLDSPPLKEAFSSLSGNKIISCGGEGGYRASDISVTPGGTSFTITAPDGESECFTTKLLGRANVQNLTLAIACAHQYGISLESQAPAVRALKGVPHRLQLIKRAGLSIIDDAYNSNPEGARVALDTLSDFAGCRILVTPGLIELGEQEYEQNRLLGEYAAGKCDYALLVGKTNFESIRQGLLSQSFPAEKIKAVKDVNDAFAVIAQIAEGDKLALLLNDLPDNYI